MAWRARTDVSLETTCRAPGSFLVNREASGSVSVTAGSRRHAPAEAGLVGEQRWHEPGLPAVICTPEPAAGSTGYGSGLELDPAGSGG